MSVFRVYLSLVGPEENITEPPDEALELDVIAGLAHLSVYNVSVETLHAVGDAKCTFALPARTLLRYLQAAIEEDEDDKVSSVLQDMNDFTASRLANRDRLIEEGRYDDDEITDEDRRRIARRRGDTTMTVCVVDETVMPEDHERSAGDGSS